jgi:hypothetical protein
MQDSSSSEDSEGDKVMGNTAKVYDRSLWLKVTFNSETKRIFKEKMSILELHERLLVIFPVLRILK